MSTPSPPATKHGRGAKEMAFLKSTLRDKSNWPIILAILVSLLIAAVNALVTIKSVYFRHVGTINETVRQLYIAGTTITATILTKFVASQFQTLLLRRFDRHLDNAGRQDLRQDSRKWRVILQAAPLKESLWPWARLRIFLSYLLIALMTTAMVAFLSPTVSFRTVLTQQSVYNGLSRHMEGNPGICTRVIPLDDARSLIDDAYFWDLGNGSAYYIPANEGGCPTRYAQLLIGNINTFDADSFAYADGGVAVHRSAIGAPISVYSPHPAQAPVLGAVLADYGSATLSTTQCVPVLTHNPIFCRTGGTTKLTNNSFTITSDDGLCTFTRTWPNRNPRVRSTMVKHMCTHTAPGVGTMVLAASGQYAHFLALTLNDTAGAPPTGPPADQTIYTITCSVDARSKYAHRLVRLDMRSNSGSDDGNSSFASPNLNSSTALNRISRYSRTLRAVGDCEGPVMDVARIATLGAANWQTLFQNDGSDGWFDLVWEAAGGHQGIMAAYGFADSTTPLADVLGLVAAMVGARFNGTEEYNVSMAVEVEATRVGSGDRVVLLWMAPVLFAAALLAGLLMTDEVQGEWEFRSVELVDLKELFLGSGSHDLKAGA